MSKHGKLLEKSCSERRTQIYLSMGCASCSSGLGSGAESGEVITFSTAKAFLRFWICNQKARIRSRIK